DIRDLHSFPTRRSSDLEDSREGSSDSVEQSEQTSSVQEDAATVQPHTDKQEMPIEPVESNLEEQELRNSVRALLRKIPSSVAVRSEEHTSELQSPCNLV